MRFLTLVHLLLHGTWLSQAGTFERTQYGHQAGSLAGAAHQKTLIPNIKDGNATGTWRSGMPPILRDMLDALEVMQDTYFDIFTGTWPDAIDWTSAVMGTHVSATLASIVSSLDASSTSTCFDMLSWQNTIDRYYAHTSVFYFGENAFAVRNQAYDDMLWVVLGWLENLKFAEMYSLRHWDFVESGRQTSSGSGWQGLQFSPMAAHRARIFYDLASAGWDESLCHGGMNWNPYLTPYKNAITNELFAAASIGMYLYFPGDNNTSPYMTQGGQGFVKPHDPAYLENAIKSYKWLMESQMRNFVTGLYQDGFHITGWHKYPNGTINPGTKNCDELNPMVYTYNQGVILSASRGLWLATGARSYLDEGHVLVESVVRATGWPNSEHAWSGMGRAGVMEEFCDHSGYCSQDGQTFKGIFFHHLSEFCRPLWPQEEAFTTTDKRAEFDRDVYEYHLARCAAYDKWVAHNSDAASATRDSDGHFGMWWTFGEPDDEMMTEIRERTTLPIGADDHLNPKPSDWSSQPISPDDSNDRGRGRTVETQSGGLAVLRARWNWEAHLRQISARKT
ncbi:uncharacterized protein Z518_02620 [Rhinocladiella mackenziei CBS 650.93]|uniref:Glycosyl hydrolase n=1 Tax=Rhinocladiella mackenziei CBS 650.93 TaxID=1442369 RepID=A0A0D2IXA7_9EURO|nr:uncharacterized protein Z518_02620 [Rhinocladiella mackenziei CBS 650.93]KIX07966.1 hypothetical protein Z518_02620 [Rhinocladiella mackenziei CBS 650.93]